jgi:hypothetical protein
MKRRTVIRIINAGLLTVMLSIIAYKYLFLGYTFESIVPQPNYSVTLHMTFQGNGEDLAVHTYLPGDEQNQTVQDENISAAGLDFRREITPLYIRGDWTRYRAEGLYSINYSFNAIIRPIRFRIQPDLRIPVSYEEPLNRFLQETDVIQVFDPYLVDLAEKLTAADVFETDVVHSLFDYVHGLGSRPFKGTTDALTAARLGEASCNGKSRLFVALARYLNIPARLVGGIILETGSKRTTHQWAELYIGGYWIPFDTLNGHFASLPGNYLALYRGDEALFRHSRNIAFDYRFEIKKKVLSNNGLEGFLSGSSLNLYHILSGFLKISIPMNILQFLLVIPLGVAVVVISRNIIGIDTYGTFLPALMAMAFQGIGLLPGIFAFVFVLTVTVLVRIPLNSLGLLHTPKLAVMMIAVIISLLGLTVISNILKVEVFSGLNTTALLPIAILTITSERVALTIEEEGLLHTVSLMLQTLLVMSISYGVMSSVALQALQIAFPELLLGIVALNLWIGSWTGIRVTEMIRFRSLFSGKGEGLK